MTISEDGLNARLCCSSSAGAATEADAIVRMLEKRAGEFFIQGKEEIARFLRDTLIPEIKERAKVHHKDRAKWLKVEDRTPLEVEETENE